MQHAVRLSVLPVLLAICAGSAAAASGEGSRCGDAIVSAHVQNFLRSSVGENYRPDKFEGIGVTRVSAERRHRSGAWVATYSVPFGYFGGSGEVELDLTSRCGVVRAELIGTD
jgi:hypothetical protein